MNLFHKNTQQRRDFLKTIGIVISFPFLSPIISSCSKSGTPPVVPQITVNDVIGIAQPSQTVLNVKPVLDPRQDNTVGYGWGTVTIATANFRCTFEQRQPNSVGSDVIMLVQENGVTFTEPTETENGYLTVKDSDIPYAVITAQAANNVIDVVKGTNTENRMKRIELYAIQGTKILTNVNKTTTQGRSMSEIFLKRLDEKIQRTTVGTTNTVLFTPSGFFGLKLVII